MTLMLCATAFQYWYIKRREESGYKYLAPDVDVGVASTFLAIIVE